VLKLLSYNIRFGGLGREQRIAQVIQSVEPDLVVFQEATDPTVVKTIAGLADYPLWAARRAHSIGFISRIPIAHHQWHRYGDARHSFLELAVGTGEARVFGLHLSAMFSRWSEMRRAREIRSLLQGIKDHQSGFHALVGDFNALAPGAVLDARRMPGWIRVLIWLSGRDIQRETIRVMLDANYVDGFRAIHPAEDGNTFPTWDPHLRLDYVFVPARYATCLADCRVIREPRAVAIASDHFPLLAQLDIPE
jgi:exodeoxyribonuclease-3